MPKSLLEPFKSATAVEGIGTHRYQANLHNDWCIGSVPHGGYVTTICLNAARLHFQTTLRGQNQPDTIALHLEFLRRASVGKATILVEDTKLGRQTSTIHVTLIQGDRQEIVGYVTNSNLQAESGLSLETDYKLCPPSLPADVKELQSDNDGNWKRERLTPFASFRKAADKVWFHYPRAGQQHMGIAEEWIKFKSEETFTTESLGFVSDMWPHVAENEEYEDSKTTESGCELEKANDAKWYPTMVLNLDIKKALPQAGVQFLFVRVQSKQIRNGRSDIEVVIMDEQGEIVALSHHITLMLSADRNLAERRLGKQSKI